MTNLSTMQAPIHKKSLLLYLASSPFAIGNLIAQEDKGGVKQLVYYISYTLRDVETYPRVKRAYLAIVNAL